MNADTTVRGENESSCEYEVIVCRLFSFTYSHTLPRRDGSYLVGTVLKCTEVPIMAPGGASLCAITVKNKTKIERNVQVLQSMIKLRICDDGIKDQSEIDVHVSAQIIDFRVRILNLMSEMRVIDIR